MLGSAQRVVVSRARAPRDIIVQFKGILPEAAPCVSYAPDVTRRTKERIAQSKRARAGSLAITDKPQVAQTCILRAFLFVDAILPFSDVRTG